MSRSSGQPRTCHRCFMHQIVYFLILIVPTTCLESFPSKTPSYLESTQTSTSTHLPYDSTPPRYPYPLPSELRVRPRYITAGPVIGYSYYECWVDNSDTRVLAAERFDYTALDPTLCGNLCALVGCSIFGVENSSECYCDNTMATTSTASVSDCSMTCAENGDDECGGFSRINIYSATTALSAVIVLGTNTALPSSSTMTRFSPPNESSSSASNGSSATLTTDAIVGIAIGSAAAGALVCSAIFLIFYRRHRRPPTGATNTSGPVFPGAYQIAEKSGQDIREIRQTSTPGYPGSPTMSEGNLYGQIHEMEVPKTQ